MSALSLAERFWKKVDKRGECWLWTGSRPGNRYGSIWNGKKMVGAHRLSWVMRNGPIPKGLYVLHHCDTPPCVNPDHLFLGTQADNLADAKRKGRTVSGEGSGRSKLTLNQVKEIIVDDRLQRVIAQDYGVCGSTVSVIKSGKSWAGVV